MHRLALLVVLLSTSAFAQTTTPSLLKFPLLDEAPNVHPSVWETYKGSTYFDTTLGCSRWTVDGHNFRPCVADLGHVEDAREEAEAVAAAALASAANALDARLDALEATAGGVSEATFDAVVSGLDGRLDLLEATSATQSQLSSAVSGLDSRLDALEGGDYVTDAEVDALATSISTVSSGLSSLATRVSTLEGSAVTAAVLNSAVATLNGRIDALPVRVCGSATISGLSVPLLGISPETTVSVPGAPAGTTCSAGSTSWAPLGARPDVVVTTVGTARLRFVSNGGLLSTVIAIPSGTYRVCCDK